MLSAGPGYSRLPDEALPLPGCGGVTLREATYRKLSIRPGDSVPADRLTNAGSACPRRIVRSDGCKRKACTGFLDLWETMLGNHFLVRMAIERG